MLTIGEFSRLSHVSARMLRHYDALGLLRPACVGENGYRYYSAQQLPTLVQIEKLKRYGFTLNEIGALLVFSEEALSRQILDKMLQTRAELERLRKTLCHMEADLNTMKGKNMTTAKYEAVIVEEPEVKVFGIRRKINISGFDALFTELFAKMETHGYRPVGYLQMLYHDKEFSYANMDVEAQMTVTQDGADIAVFPGGAFVRVIHKGPYEIIHYAYEALTLWMAEHIEYKICGPAVERYLVEKSMTTDPDKYETAVMFRIAKAV